MVKSTSDLFHRTFQRPPNHLVSAPGRVNLIGEHVDYNGGVVVPMAIDKRTWIAGALNGTRSVHLKSSGYEEVVKVDMEKGFKPSGGWEGYVMGVLQGCRNAGMPIEGFDAVIDSTVPMGAGLSSSAALEVATATLVESLTGTSMAPLSKAKLCRTAEQDFAGVPCGLMDQLISTAACARKVMVLDCLTETYGYAPFEDPGVQVLIVNSHISHDLKDGAYAERREACFQAAKHFGVELLGSLSMTDFTENQSGLGSDLLPRVRHVLSEVQRAKAFAKCLEASDWKTAGKLMYESHTSLKEEYEVSCREIDFLVEQARHMGLGKGVYGCRMTGGGFGGCVVALIQTRAAERIMETLRKSYHAYCGIEPTCYICQPTHGALNELSGPK